MIKGIFIVAGHGLSASGGLDNGAVGNGTTERKEVVEMAQELFGRLLSDERFRGVNVIKIGVDSRMSLVQKIAQVNAICRQLGWGENDALLLSLHVNAAGNSAARGLEAWYSRNEGTLSFAQTLVDRVSRATGMPQRAQPTKASDLNRHGRLGILDDTVPRGVLFEAGFISNEFDAAFIKDNQLDDFIVKGLYDGLVEYLDSIGGFQSGGGGAVVSFPNTTTSFRDVPVNAWYAEAVELCLREGIIEMQTDGLFHPGNPLTRAEMAVVMARHLREHHGLT